VHGVLLNGRLAYYDGRWIESGGAQPLAFDR
jgi:hypothetical protein